MNYEMEEYINPPAPIVSNLETNTLNGEVLDVPRRPDLPTKKSMRLKDILLSVSGNYFCLSLTSLVGKGEADVTSITHLLNIFIYVLFLIVIVYIAFCRSSNETYYYNSILKTTFTKCPQKDGTDLVDVNVIDDVWDVRKNNNKIYIFVQFLNATVIEMLYWPNTVDSLQIEGMVLFENTLLGNPTLRMLKVYYVNKKSWN